MTQPYPIPREPRSSGVLAFDGVSTTFGPFDFKIFDIEDVTVEVRLDGETFFSPVSVVIAKTADEPHDTFSVTFDQVHPATAVFVVYGNRVPERSATVTKGGGISSPALEKELSKIAIEMQELRSQIDRCISLDPGASPSKVVVPGDANHILITDGKGNLVDGGLLSDLGAIPGGGGSTDLSSILAALALKAPIASPTFTGVPSAPTAAPGTDTTQIATTAFVAAGLAGKVDKVTGKQLSTEDFTTILKEKLELIDPSSTGGGQSFKLTFGSVAVLLANTLLGYTGDYAVSAGDAVAAGRHTYTVAASDASDHHVATAGGVKLYVVPSPAGYDVKAFGAVGDASADDTAAVQKAFDTGSPYISVGWFVTTGITCPDKVTICGVPKWSTIYGGVTYTNSAQVPVADPGEATPSSSVFSAWGVDFIGGTGANDYALSIVPAYSGKFCESATLKDVRFYGRNGLLVRNVLGSDFDNLAFYTTAIGQDIQGCTNLTWRACRTNNAAAYGTIIRPPTTGVTTRQGGESCRFENCMWAGCSTGLYAVRHRWLEVDTCMFDYCGCSILLKGCLDAQVQNTYGSGSTVPLALSDVPGYVAPFGNGTIALYGENDFPYSTGLSADHSRFLTYTANSANPVFWLKGAEGDYINRVKLHACEFAYPNDGHQSPQFVTLEYCQNIWVSDNYFEGITNSPATLQHLYYLLNSDTTYGAFRGSNWRNVASLVNEPDEGGGGSIPANVLTASDKGRTIGKLITWEDFSGVPAIITEGSTTILTRIDPGVEDYADFSIRRDTTGLSGGTFGYANAALRVDTTTGDGQTSFEWNILGVLENYATAGENVAGYFQGRKRSTGHTWGAVCQIIDYAEGTTNGPAVGLEVTCTGAAATDLAFNRVGLNVGGHRLGVSGTCVFARGVWTSSNTGFVFGRPFANSADYTDTVWHNDGTCVGGGNQAVFWDEGTGASWGIRLNASYANAAIGLNAGQKISLEPTNVVTISYESSKIQLAGVGVNIPNGLTVANGLSVSSGTLNAVNVTATGSVSLNSVVNIGGVLTASSRISGADGYQMPSGKKFFLSTSSPLPNLSFNGTAIVAANAPFYPTGRLGFSGSLVTSATKSPSGYFAQIELDANTNWYLPLYQ